MLIFVGSTAGGEGVSVFSQDTDGALEAVGEPLGIACPTFLIEHPSLPILYAVNTLPDGAVTALAIGADGGLVRFSSAPSGGVQPSHAAVTPDGRYLICCHYGGPGVVSVLPVAADGSLRPASHVEIPVPTAEQRAISHHVTLVGDEVVVTFLALGEIRGYRIAPDGSLTRAWTAKAESPKAGPRHLVRHPAGTWLGSDEVAANVSVYVPVPDAARGGLSWKASTPASRATPNPDDPNHPAELALSPDARHLYVANRGPDTIATFAVGADGRQLQFLGESPTGGTRPRHFALAGHRIYVANERSAQITMLTIDPESDLPGDPRVVAEVQRPTCILPRG